jgi:hypothetical protein
MLTAGTVIFDSSLGRSDSSLGRTANTAATFSGMDAVSTTSQIHSFEVQVCCSHENRHHYRRQHHKLQLPSPLTYLLPGLCIHLPPRSPSPPFPSSIPMQFRSPWPSSIVFYSSISFVVRSCCQSPFSTTHDQFRSQYLVGSWGGGVAAAGANKAGKGQFTTFSLSSFHHFVFSRSVCLRCFSTR